MVRQLKLSPEGEADAYPLSPMQQGMLFHRFEGEPGSVDVEQVICELHEDVDAARFEQAWREVIGRHAPLRTGFRWDEQGEPEQVVYPETHVRLALHHQDYGSPAEARRGLQEYLKADRREGFPALTPPLLRVALLRGGPAHFWFVTTYHHLVLDARSMTIVFREVLELHDALVQGRTLDLPRPRAYRSYIDWLQTHDLGRAKTFWQQQLRGFTSPTELPILRRDDVRREPGAASGELAFQLPAITTLGLRALARTHDVTLNTIAQAAWSRVLSRYTGSDDVVFGAVRACRKIPVEGAAAMVGLFINTVPVRVRLAPEVRIGTWLRQIREQWIAVRDFEHTPLAQVQRWSDVAAGRVLFDSILSYQEPAWDAALNALGGAWARRTFDRRAQPSHPLAIEILAGSTLTVKCIYDHARFTSSAMAGVMAYLRLVFESLAGNAADTIGSLPLLTREEHEQITRWNATAVDYPRDQCVQTFVEMHARTSPESIAVSDARQGLTYAELNARANRLARHLQRRGVMRGTLVCVCMNRSVEMIVAWLGILKAGAAFVPLDPAYPKDRLAFQIEDCGARVLLVSAQSRPAPLELSSRVTLIPLRADGGDFEDELDSDLTALGSARDVAYVIFTSGSTGRPKGVEIEHRALMNLVSWHQRAYAITAVDRASHLASPAFDAAVWEIWPYLAAGASVHIPDDETRVSAGPLWQWMAEKKISIAFMPTPLAEEALRETWPEGLALRILLTGGDTLKRRPPAHFPCTLINHYGPTESTVVATSAVIGSTAASGALLPIGRPIANTQAHVLDRRLQPVPIGVPGELYLGGESLARGYLRRPELTAESFISNPFDRRGSARLYRTGDLVRWTADGELEFLGREDGQVKIRGCRIELGEIEAALQQHPAVRESIVQARTDDRKGRQLIAYVLAAAHAHEAEVGGIVDFLHAKLPAYMVPSAIIMVDAWPLTPNGKVDRNALSAVAVSAPKCDRESEGPRTVLEESIARIWADVLGRASVGRDDHFFDLGGHSLLAAQVVSRLNSALGGAISVRTLFEQPTLAGFACEVERQRRSNPARLPVQRMKRRTARAALELVQPR